MEGSCLTDLGLMNIVSFLRLTYKALDRNTLYASLNVGYPLRPESHRLSSCEEGSYEKIFLAVFAFLVNVSLHFTHFSSYCS